MITPQYVFSKEQLRLNYKKMCSLLKNCQIFYTLKTNAESTIIDELKNYGASFECASKNEFKTLIDMNIPLEKIIFGLPIKSEDVIEYVYKNGGQYFIFEEMDELKKLRNLAPDSKKILRLYINDLVPSTIDYGMQYEDIFKYDEEMQFLDEIDGISFHISKNYYIEDIKKVCGRVEKLLNLLKERSQKEYILNIGGGFKIDAGGEYYNYLNKVLERFKSAYNLKIYAELGESIVGSSGKFYTRVVMTKSNGRMIDVYMDSGSPQGVAARVPPPKVRVFGHNEYMNKSYIYRFIDCTCLGTTLFNKRLNLNICDNDILEFDDCGAYTVVFRNEFQGYEKCLITYK